MIILSHLFTKRRLIIIIVLLVLIGIVAILYFSFIYEGTEVRRSTDKDFILLESEISSNQKSTLLVYQYDTGALGFSRKWWAVVPVKYDDKNLAEYELPDGYKAIGWADNGDLLVKKWEPYYYLDENIDLVTGDFLNGVRMKIIN